MKVPSSQRITQQILNQNDSAPASIGFKIIGGRTFYLPIDGEQRNISEFPPDTPVDTIPEGLGLLEVSGGEEGLILTNRGGELVRVVMLTDTVVERINFNTAAWEDENIGDLGSRFTRWILLSPTFR